MQDKRLERSIGYSLVRVFRQVNRATNRALRRFGLSAEQAHILVVLWLEGPLKIGELQRLLMLSSPTLTGAIDRMERAGLVRRVDHPEDGRAWRVEPTGVDARTRRAIEAALSEIEVECFGALRQSERRELRRLLEKVSESLPE